eukprot:scaffold8583_cov119-Isochrysis_galbana.AAC.3
MELRLREELALWCERPWGSMGRASSAAFQRAHCVTHKAARQGRGRLPPERAVRSRLTEKRTSAVNTAGGWGGAWAPRLRAASPALWRGMCGDRPPAGEKFTTISTWRREGEGWTQDGAYGRCAAAQQLAGWHPRGVRSAERGEGMHVAANNVFSPHSVCI